MCDLFYREFNQELSRELEGRPEEREPIILVHGLFGSGDNLGALARGLSTNFRVIAVDMRNHGRSPHTDEMTYEAMAGDLVELLERLEIKSAHFFGHSMGGKAVMKLALTNPEKVKRLIVCDVAPVTYAHDHDDIISGLKAVASSGAGSRKEAREILTKYETSPQIIEFLLTNWRRTEAGWAWRLNVKVIDERYGDIRAAVSGKPFAGEVLFIRGGLSNYITGAYRQEILTLFPGASVRTIEGAGHWVHAEKPDLTLRLVDRFIASGK